MSSEKNEKPTPKKLDDARKKGQVAMSRDLPRLGMLLVIGELAFVAEPYWREAIEAAMVKGIMRIGQPFVPALMEQLWSATVLVLLVFCVCFVLCSVTAIATHWGQFGVLIAPEALTPKFDKLNPVNGAKQIFSGRKLVELLITVAKAMLIGWIVFLVARNELPAILHLSGGTPIDVYTGFVAVLRSIFHIILVICLLLAMVDFAIQKYFHTKQLMMDIEEIKREYKETEGDPLVKGMRRQLARQLAMSGPAAATKNANAVVVNPTHYAVALFYDPDIPMVPVVLARGQDDIAQAMIDTAKSCGIPVIRHVWLARTLYATALEDEPVPRASYEAVAHVYAVVHQLLALNQTGRTVELESYGEPPASHTS